MLSVPIRGVIREIREYAFLLAFFTSSPPVPPMLRVPGPALRKTHAGQPSPDGRVGDVLSFATVFFATTRFVALRWNIRGTKPVEPASMDANPASGRWKDFS